MKKAEKQSKKLHSSIDLEKDLPGTCVSDSSVTGIMI